MDPMFEMQFKYILQKDSLSETEKLELSQCLDLAYAIGAVSMATDPKMPAQTGKIRQKLVKLREKLDV